MKKTVVTTCTRDCANTCGLVATVDNGRLVKLAGDPDHPLTRGVACHKAAKYVRRVYNPERVTHPLIRRNGVFERASWDEALDLVAQRMQDIAAETGPESILYYQGYGERTALKLLNKYFFNLFGPVTTLRGSLCGGAGQGSQNLDVGDRVSHDPLDHYNSASMILWGRNPVSTNISLVPIIRDIRKRGGRVILVDPAASRSVQLAERHIAPHPGRDCFLAMAAAKLVLAAGAEDREFLENRTEGWAEYRSILDRYEVDDLCARAGVSVDDAEYLAETLMTQRPTSILMGWGLHRYEYADYSIRCVDALGAVAGLLGAPGGGVSQGFEEYGAYDEQWWGDHLHPDRRTLLMPTVGEELLAATDPAIRMIVVTAANPVCMAPNADKVARAFKKAEFIVYSGHFLDDTSDLADVFLPATTFLEEDDFMGSYGHNFVGPVNRAIEPVGECRSEFEMFHGLAARFAFAEEFRKSAEEWFQLLLKPVLDLGVSLDELRECAYRLPAPMVPYEGGVFPTPSGKYRFITELEPANLADCPPEYPFRFLTIAAHGYICSERTMAEHTALPEITMNAVDAGALGLESGAPVEVSSLHGRTTALLRTDPDQRPGVVVAERGGWAKAGHGLNRLTRDLASKVGNGTPYYESCVSVAPCAGERARVLVVQHCDRAPGGNFCKQLERRGAELTTLWPENGDALPANPDGYDALVVLGGPQHAFDDGPSPHFPRLLELMRAFDAAGRPVAGICLGCQLLARAHGGQPAAMGDLEYGFTALEATAEGGEDPVLAPALPLPRLMEFHQDTFSLPPEAALLVRGAACPNQAFRVGRASYGFQFHLEADPPTVAAWIELLQKDEEGEFARYAHRYDAEFFGEFQADLALLTARSEEFCRKVADVWLDLARKDRP
ncbi:molybdopterin-dependent oxidoreductase [Desulfocurvus sp. DL9XJH121]